MSEQHLPATPVITSRVAHWIGLLMLYEVVGLIVVLCLR